MRFLGAPLALFFQVEQLPLGLSKSLVDRAPQVGMLVLSQEVIGFVADHDFAVPRYAKLDPHHRRDRPAHVLGALVDPNPAGNEPLIDFFQVGDAGADFLLGLFRSLDVVEGDFKRHLHGSCSLPLSLLGFSITSRRTELFGWMMASRYQRDRG